MIYAKGLFKNQENLYSCNYENTKWHEIIQKNTHGDNRPIFSEEKSSFLV